MFINFFKAERVLSRRLKTWIWR